MPERRSFEVQWASGTILYDVTRAPRTIVNSYELVRLGPRLEIVPEIRLDGDALLLGVAFAFEEEVAKLDQLLHLLAANADGPHPEPKLLALAELVESAQVTPLPASCNASLIRSPRAVTRLV